MRSFAEWYGRTSQSQAGALIDARPAPMLVLNTSSYYVLFITAKNGEFVAILDDQDAGSIPSQQTLGALTENPAVVLRRAVDTALWYAKKQLAEGASARGAWYLETVNHIARFTGMPELAAETDELIWARLVERAQTDPSGAVSSLGTWGQKFSRAGNWQRAVEARMLAGDAAERASLAGDARFDGQAKTHYSIALDYIPENQGLTLASEIRARLGNLA